VHCLIIGKVWPEPTSTAAGRRVGDILRALQSADWQLSFACTARSGPHSLKLGSLGVDCHQIQTNDSGFDAWIEALAPDIVIFDRFMIEEQFGWRVEKSCPQALRVLDTSDLHCLREARQQQLKNGGELNLFNEVALREIASIHRSDVSLMISEYEVDLLQHTFGVSAAQLLYWPFGIQQIDSQSPGFEARQHFIMIGSFQHAPNLDAARWCKQAIWPLIHQALPGSELHCYGSYGEKYANELDARASGFHFKGRAQEALATMRQYRVNLAPLRFGAGLKGKLFDAFETRTPSVTTPIGAEAIPGDGLEWGCAVSADPAVYAATAIELYKDKEAWRRVQQQGLCIATERFSADFWQGQLPRLLLKVLSGVEQHRQSNFVGRLLRHHHQRSTEYMSRWIEAKNQKNYDQ